jgi:hypothetical protein
MGRLVLVPLGAVALFSAMGWLAHEQTDARRIEAVAKAVVASGQAGPVHVEPIRGDECWRSREGFAWRTPDAVGWACAGPGDEVRRQARATPAQEGP